MKLYSILFLIISLTIGCQSITSQKEDKTGKDVADNQKNEGESVKMIFYNVPSPVEMVLLVQNAGAIYNKDLLNPYKNVDNYITTDDLALNLGVYGADLSYNRIFDQMQESINYLAAIRKISDDLKIPQDEGSFMLNQFEKYMNNKDSLLYIISETYANADIYLKENARESTASLVILGGWIEALFIATNLVDAENPDKNIMERIAEQKYSIQHINNLIADYREETIVLNDLYPKMKELEDSFNKISIEYEKGEVKTDANAKTTTFGGKSTITVDYSNILEIKNIITEIRKDIIGKS